MRRLVTARGRLAVVVMRRFLFCTALMNADGCTHCGEPVNHQQKNSEKLFHHGKCTHTVRLWFFDTITLTTRTLCFINLLRVVLVLLLKKLETKLAGDDDRAGNGTNVRKTKETIFCRWPL